MRKVYIPLERRTRVTKFPDGAHSGISLSIFAGALPRENPNQRASPLWHVSVLPSLFSCFLTTTDPAHYRFCRAHPLSLPPPNTRELGLIEIVLEIRHAALSLSLYTVLYHTFFPRISSNIRDARLFVSCALAFMVNIGMYVHAKRFGITL